MWRTTPLISEGWLYDPATPAAPIRVDTPAWFAWLAAPTTTRFAYPVIAPTVGYIIGVLTVRKERRQRGDGYWSAYHRSRGRLCKVYLGRSPAVTLARLARAAAVLAAAGRP